MDDVREELNAIDRALAEALDVRESADFGARVRERIANEPAPGSWAGWRIALTAAAAAVAVAAAGVAMLSPRGSVKALPLTARSVSIGRMLPADVGPARRVQVEAPAPRVNRTIAAPIVGPSQESIVEPEVLVPQNEIEMYRRLIAAAQNVPGVMLVEAPKDIVASAAFAEITIEPIKIELIIPPVSGEGDRQ